ncbi:MAG: N-acetyltransferase [Acidobacteria bacterium]|nr:MAG: N-acetyltransferase [Acidobacteriota bacterium]
MKRSVIRDETNGDTEAIRRVHLEAFGGDVEARIVDLLREAGNSIISLVATVGAEIVGHVVFSPVAIAEAPPGFGALGLGPVGVRPGSQTMGFGSALIREGLRRCERDGYDAVFVLGSPKYYIRFGFAPAQAFGFENEWGIGDEFMVLTLRENARSEVHGLVRYAPAFLEAGI